MLENNNEISPASSVSSPTSTTTNTSEASILEEPSALSSPEVAGTRPSLGIKRPTEVRGHGQLLPVGAGAVTLHGILQLPEQAHGLVLLAQGIVRTELHPHRSILALANALHERNIATFQVDLFTTEERKIDQETGYFRQNTDIMQQRLIGMADWFLEHTETQNLSIGYFGIDEAGAAALIAAAERPDVVAAVVAAGATLHLAGSYLPTVLAPTLLIAPAQDTTILREQQEILAQLKAEKHAEQIAGVSTLLGDARALAEVARLAGDWFDKRLTTII